MKRVEQGKRQVNQPICAGGGEVPRVWAAHMGSETSRRGQCNRGSLGLPHGFFKTAASKRGRAIGSLNGSPWGLSVWASGSGASTAPAPGVLATCREAQPLMRDVLSKSSTIRGFINYDFGELYPDFLRDIGPSIKDGEIKYKEDIVDGLDNAPKAFMGMLEGRNFGKLLIRMRGVSSSE